MARVRIVTDSACDLTQDEAAELGVEIVPLSIRFGDDEYVDREELDARAFYEKMASSDVLPETAAPSPGAFEERFRKLRSEGADAVICINLSRDLSATMEAAQQAARSVQGEIEVHVVDSKSITAGLGNQVLHAARAARDGRSVDEILGMLQDLIGRTHVFGTLDTLENLKKGGRIGGAQALLGSMLSIKPVLDLSDGSVQEAAKVRTRKKALAWFVEKLRSAAPVEDLAVMHAEASDVDDLVALIREAFPDQPIRVDVIGAVIGTHGGAGTMGLCWVDAA